MRTNWDKIVAARIVEGVLTALAFGVGLWHTINSKKLEEDLDKHFDEEELEEASGDDS